MDNRKKSALPSNILEATASTKQRDENNIVQLTCLYQWNFNSTRRKSTTTEIYISLATAIHVLFRLGGSPSTLQITNTITAEAFLKSKHGPLDEKRYGLKWNWDGICGGGGKLCAGARNLSQIRESKDIFI